MKPTDEQIKQAAEAFMKPYAHKLHLGEEAGHKNDLICFADYLLNEWPGALSQMQPEWVAVTEGYPEIGAQCYFYRRGTSDFVFTGQYNGIDQWGDNCFKEDDRPAYYRDVTHYLVFSKPQPPNR